MVWVFFLDYANFSSSRRRRSGLAVCFDPGKHLVKMNPVFRIDFQWVFGVFARFIFADVC
jgi:hypothetical protein